ncbi:MAG: aldehyde dehydrogenase family protein [Desulfobacterium sp.]|jgi:succinate-semialdehyde dehydrogenase/glutarate-semialdehyde dehydrogenase|nr:aldehyde dehydrogenase family protein [Desulfobacterium sp.]
MRQTDPAMDAEQTECINPSTGEVIGYSPIHSPEEVARCIEAARKVQPAWQAVSIKERARMIVKIQPYMVERMDHLAATIARNNGKTRTDALATEILPAIASLTYYRKRARKFLKDRSLMPGGLLFINKKSKILRIPYGVVGIISPWNYPFSIPFSEVIMALLAGNCVILKVASETQLPGLALKECIEAAGLPQGVFSYVNLEGSKASGAMLDNGIDKLFFTGSVGVGKKLAELAAKTLTPVCLELGGNDAMLVCEDADLYRAAAGAVWAGFQNAGQSCGGVERIYVHASVHDRFLEILKEKTENLKVGFDTDFTMDIGAMTTLRQVETVKHHVDDALAKGAVIYARAKAPLNSDSPHFVPPMVLTKVNHDMLVMNEETFGPVVGVMKVTTMDQAVELANDSTLGLTCSVWSGNRKNAEHLARQIKTGVAMVNDHLMSHGLPETPWGGPKETGGGRTHGEIGFGEMTYPQVIVHDFFTPVVRKNLWWHPFSKSVYDGIKGAAQLFYGTNIRRRLKGGMGLMAILPRMFKP